LSFVTQTSINCSIPGLLSQDLAAAYKGDPVNEFLTFFRAGVDGVFTDFSNTGFGARAQFLKESGR